MGFLLGAAGKLFAGRRLRSLQRELTHVQAKISKATKQASRMSDMIAKAKQSALNNLTYQQQTLNGNLQGQVLSSLNMSLSDLQTAQTTSGTGGTGNEKVTQYNSVYSTWKSNIEAYMTNQKQQIEDYYENLELSLVEPYHQEEEYLETRKESLTSQIEVAKADYESFKEMEKTGASNLKASYNGVS